MQTEEEEFLGTDAGMGEPRVRDATRLLREFLDVSDAFERSLGVELEVNQTDLEAMEHLLMSGPLGPSELARRLGISTASATTAIDRLVAVGHVTREPNPRDRRGVLVVPNEASRARAMARLMPMIIGVDAQLDHFSAGEQETITRYLRRVVDLYQEHVGEDPRAR
ncbi:MarR family transcriptional regulator [Microbacterium sp. NPDC064584]|uniref:MarR family winged helix-turn-helix transcriptional regulator n=1 Tax=Microbacterium sp. NPDC064584 TaxID=3155817 RepID=UPI003448C76F